MYELQDQSPRGFIPRSRRAAALRRKALEALLVSAGIVALAEMGDKTRLLALVLATGGRCRSFWASFSRHSRITRSPRGSARGSRT
jgi:hypothetical protein